MIQFIQDIQEQFRKKVSIIIDIIDIMDRRSSGEIISRDLDNGPRADEADKNNGNNGTSSNSTCMDMDLLQLESEKIKELLKQVKENAAAMSRIAQLAKANVDELAIKQNELQSELELAVRVEKEAKQKQEEVSRRIEHLHK